jgi:hypothetical protein
LPISSGGAEKQWKMISGKENGPFVPDFPASQVDIQILNAAACSG